MHRAVFNNLFDSFHNTVAEAKEEREQLDRLLTISTPRERLLVTAMALLLLILTAWLFLGNVARSHAADGVLTGAGEALSGGKQQVQALVWVGGDAAPQIEAGMPVTIDLATADGDADGATDTPDTLGGRIATISPAPLSAELAAFAPAAPLSVHRVTIALDDSLDPATVAGRKCRVVIELGRQSPAALFRVRHP